MVNDPRADSPPSESAAREAARILVADDEGASRKLLAVTLEGFGLSGAHRGQWN
jgi:hypothetical protein